MAYICISSATFFRVSSTQDYDDLAEKVTKCDRMHKKDKKKIQLS